MAINDVLPLEAARRSATANFKCFGVMRHERHNFDGFIYIRYAAPLYSVGISVIYLLLFEFRLLTSLCDAWQWTMQNLRRVGRSRRKTNKCIKFLADNFFRKGWPQIFHGRLARFTFYRLTKFSWVLLRLLNVCEACQWSRMQNLQRVGKMTVQF